MRLSIVVRLMCLSPKQTPKNAIFSLIPMCDDIELGDNSVINAAGKAVCKLKLGETETMEDVYVTEEQQKVKSPGSPWGANGSKV